ncbi:MAG: GyrI-like domain-containing protein [Cyclobacteriaceae bacterium]
MKSTMEKLDLSKADKTYYKATKKPQVVDLDAYYYLTIEGQSAPEDPQFMDAIGAIYPIAYGIKFDLKAEGKDFTVPKMEAYWFVKGGAKSQGEFKNTPRDKWCWKILVRMPDFVESDHFFRAVAQAKEKNKSSQLDQVKFELINEGKCAQILHIGSYEAEEETINTLHNFIWENGMQITGYHKEVYLSDPRRAAEDKLRTIIRYSVN